MKGHADVSFSVTTQYTLTSVQPCSIKSVACGKRELLPIKNSEEKKLFQQYFSSFFLSLFFSDKKFSLLFVEIRKRYELWRQLLTLDLLHSHQILTVLMHEFIQKLERYRKHNLDTTKSRLHEIPM